MGLIMDVHGAAEGYEAVTLPLLLEEPSGTHGLDGAVLRRRTARPTKRAVIYLHCIGDSFVPADLASWYTDRGFHFYAADLRAVGGSGPPARAENHAGELGEYLACLDTAVSTCGRRTASRPWCFARTPAGALIAALWCHARRGSQPVDALILASPSLRGRPWLARPVGRRARARAEPAAPRRCSRWPAAGSGAAWISAARSWSVPGRRLGRAGRHRRRWARAARGPGRPPGHDPARRARDLAAARRRAARPGAARRRGPQARVRRAGPLAQRLPVRRRSATSCSSG